MFDAGKIKNECVEWIREFFEKNGKGCNAVIGISGGKDSSIVAALCVEALGKDRVIGVLMPNGTQPDIDMAYMLVEHLGIRHCEINISDACRAVLRQMESLSVLKPSGYVPWHSDVQPRARSMYIPRYDRYEKMHISEQTKINLPARIRMATLYAVSQSNNGRVANTCNLSEDWVGYSTRYGDSVGDFSPCSNLTVREMKAVGRECGLPGIFIDKVPSDGLTGKTDEDNFGFTYDELDTYIRTGEIKDEKHREMIDRRHEQNLFKLRPMPSYKPSEV